VNQFYDIPTISLRGPFLHDVLGDIEKVKEFFVVGSDDHSNDNPKIGNTDLRHVSCSALLPSYPFPFCMPFFALSSISPLLTASSWYLDCATGSKAKR